MTTTVKNVELIRAGDRSEHVEVRLCITDITDAEVSERDVLLTFQPTFYDWCDLIIDGADGEVSAVDLSDSATGQSRKLDGRVVLEAHLEAIIRFHLERLITEEAESRNRMEVKIAKENDPKRRAHWEAWLLLHEEVLSRLLRHRERIS